MIEIIVIVLLVCAVVYHMRRKAEESRRIDAYHAQVEEAELIDRVARLPNSGVSALDRARAAKILEEERRRKASGLLGYLARNWYR